jgi:hypothetical protein
MVAGVAGEDTDALGDKVAITNVATGGQSQGGNAFDPGGVRRCAQRCGGSVGEPELRQMTAPTRSEHLLVRGRKKVSRNSTTAR